MTLTRSDEKTFLYIHILDPVAVIKVQYVHMHASRVSVVCTYICECTLFLSVVYVVLHTNNAKKGDEFNLLFCCFYLSKNFDYLIPFEK